MKHEVKTSYQLKKEANDQAAYNDFKKLMAKPGSMVTAVNKIVMEKYGICAASTLWSIRKKYDAMQMSPA